MSAEEDLAKRNNLALAGGGQARIEKQHEVGKLTARERLGILLDPDSFFEFDKLVTSRDHSSSAEVDEIYGDGVITGWGRINGRKVFVFAQDFTVYGGSLGAAHAKKNC